MDCISTRAKVAGCLLVIVLVHVVQQVDDAVAVAILVVIPADTKYPTFTPYSEFATIWLKTHMLTSATNLWPFSTLFLISQRSPGRTPYLMLYCNSTMGTASMLKIFRPQLQSDSDTVWSNNGHQNETMLSDSGFCYERETYVHLDCTTLWST